MSINDVIAKSKGSRYLWRQYLIHHKKGVIGRKNCQLRYWGPIRISNSTWHTCTQRGQFHIIFQAFWNIVFYAFGSWKRLAFKRYYHSDWLRIQSKLDFNINESKEKNITQGAELRRAPKRVTCCLIGTYGWPSLILIQTFSICHSSFFLTITETDRTFYLYSHEGDDVRFSQGLVS